MLKYGYGWQKFYEALMIMVSSNDIVQERIAKAYSYSLIHVNPDRDLPNELRSKYGKMVDAFNSQEDLNNEGTALASAKAMSDDEAADIATSIVSMFSDIAQEQLD